MSTNETFLRGLQTTDSNARNRLIAPALLLALVSACGGGGGSPTGPSPSTGPIGATITITNGVVSPKTVTINGGEAVTFVNNDSRPHEMASDPHPEHTDCPPINAVGLLQPGQTRNTAALTTTRSCGFHDHSDSGNANLQGTITVR